MKSKPLLSGLLVVISLLTILSGLFQMVATSFLLRMLSAEITPGGVHFFAIVGMFMVLFGGMLLQALMNPVHDPVIVFWAGMQKFGAAIAVGLGVSYAIFSKFALLVAGFDLLSAVLIISYWISLRE